MNRVKTFFYAFLAVMMVPNVMLVISERQQLFSAVANLLLPLGIYWLLLSSCRKIGTIVWIMLPLVFLAAFQIVITMLFGQSIIGVDMFLNVVTTNMTEINELLGSLVPAVALVFGLYIPMLVMATVAMRRRWALDASFIKKQRCLAAACIIAGLSSVIVATGDSTRPMRMTDDVFPVNVTYNLCIAVDRYVSTKNYPQTSASFSFGARREVEDSTGGKEIIVLVIGETARAANFGVLGYGRNTTPCLSAMEGVTVFRKAYTESNTTHKSVPMLLSAVSAHNFNDIYRQKSVITACKEAGFLTAFFSNQRRNGSFIDFFGEEADRCRFIKDDYPAEVNVMDKELLKYVEQFVNEAPSDKPLFIVLHCYGSHFNYRERYPEEFSVFKPDDCSEATAANRQSLLNAYDNTIVYTDHILSSLVAILDKARGDVAMVYTSDHGEDIFDDGQHFLHASIVPTDYQLHVPLMVWLSKGYSEHRPEIAAAMKSNAESPISTSQSLFHTILDMVSIKTRYFEESLSLASRHYKFGGRYFINDRNEAEEVPHSSLLTLRLMVEGSKCMESLSKKRERRPVSAR